MNSRPMIGDRPLISKKNLSELLKRLTINQGDTVIVHSSLKSLGYVIGGPETVIDALIDTVGGQGTIIMPTQTVELSDPSTWEYPPVNKLYWDFIRNNRRPFDPITTPVTKGIGIIPETFRKYPGVIRTNHPLYSFAIYGNKANEIGHQSFDFGLGINSPLGQLYTEKIKAKILFLGTDFESNTSLHLAEHFLGREAFKQSSLIIEDNKIVEKEFLDIPLDINDDFLDIQAQYQNENSYMSENIHNGVASVYPFLDVVSFAIKYYKNEAPSDR